MIIQQIRNATLKITYDNKTFLIDPWLQDKVAGLYDLFENIYNKSVYQSTGENVAKYIKNTDRVLECACGTGAISIYIASICNQLYASDFSAGMLKQAIPTYINGDEGTNKLAVKFLEKLGANFKRQFDSESYEQFFADMGQEEITYEVVRGRMSCDIAIIEVKKNL